MNGFFVNGRAVFRWSLALWAMGCVFFMALPAWSEAGLAPEMPSLSASVDKNAARIGEMVWLKLTYVLPEGARLPEVPTIHGTDNLTIVERVVREGEIKIGIIVDRLHGSRTDPIGLTYLDKEGNEQRIETGPVEITVLSNLGDKPEEAALKPIQDILSTAPKWKPYLLWGAVLFLLLCIVMGCLWWKKRHRPERIAATTVDPPHVQAEKEIDRLVAGGLFEKGEVKAFYFIFSEIIRRYMASIRHFPAAEMTTEEIARFAAADTDDQEILPLLRQTDLVKFADTAPTPDRKTNDIQAARTYIRQTGHISAQSPEVGQ